MEAHGNNLAVSGPSTCSLLRLCTALFLGGAAGQAGGSKNRRVRRHYLTGMSRCLDPRECFAWGVLVMHFSLFFAAVISRPFGIFNGHQSWISTRTDISLTSWQCTTYLLAGWPYTLGVPYSIPYIPNGLVTLILSSALGASAK